MSEEPTNQPAAGAPPALPAEDLSGERQLRGVGTAVGRDGVRRPVLGSWVLISRSGSDAVGVEYAAEPREHEGPEVVLKVLRRDVMDGHPEAAMRLLHEVRTAEPIRADHLARILEVGRDEHSGIHFVILRPNYGVRASRWAPDRPRPGQKPLAEEHALALCRIVAATLAALHGLGFVHRDVHPGNVLVPMDERGGVTLSGVRLLNFGMARPLLPGEALARWRCTVGTPGFAAPEQMRNARAAGKRADVFSVGAMLYAFLTGSSPFGGGSARETLAATKRGEYLPLAERRPEISRATQAVVDICLSRNPAARFPDAAALRDALDVCAVARVGSESRAARAVSRVMGFVQREEEGAPFVDRAPRPPRGKHLIPWLKRGAAAAAVLAALVWAAQILPPLVADVADAAAGVVQSAREALRAAPTVPATLHVRSAPVGATVTLDGEERGVTPLALTLAPGAYEVEVRHARYESQARAIELIESQTRELDVTLALRYGAFGVHDGVPGTRVVVTARDGGPTRTYTIGESGRLPDIRLPVGRYDVRATVFGFAPFETDVEVGGDGLATVRLPMGALAGWIDLSEYTDGVQVELDGRALGARTPTAPGEKILIVRSALGRERPVRVTVASGQTVRPPVVFAPAPEPVHEPTALAAVTGRGERERRTPLPPESAALETSTRSEQHMTAAGEPLRLSARATLWSLGVSQGVETVVLGGGGVSMAVSDHTRLLLADGTRIRAAAGSRTRIFAHLVASATDGTPAAGPDEPPSGRAVVLRSWSGRTIVQFAGFDVLLPPGTGVRLEVEAEDDGGEGGPARLRFCTVQDAVADVNIASVRSGAQIQLRVPPATRGDLGPARRGDRTRVAHSGSDDERAQLGVRLDAPGRESASAELPLGSYALLDRSLGRIEQRRANARSPGEVVLDRYLDGPFIGLDELDREADLDAAEADRVRRLLERYWVRVLELVFGSAHPERVRAALAAARAPGADRDAIARRARLRVRDRSDESLALFAEFPGTILRLLGDRRERILFDKRLRLSEDRETFDFVRDLLTSSRPSVLRAGGGSRTDPLNDSEGSEPVSGRVRIGRIDRSSVATNGLVRYSVDNLSAERDAELRYTVWFYRRGSSPDAPPRVEITEARSISLRAGEVSRDLAAVSPSWRQGETIAGTRLVMEINDPQLVRPAAGIWRGQRWADGRLECAAYEGLESEDGTVRVTLRNVSEDTLSGLEVQTLARGLGGERTLARGPWRRLPDLAPGESATVTARTRELGDLRVRTLWLLVR